MDKRYSTLHSPEDSQAPAFQSLHTPIDPPSQNNSFRPSEQPIPQSPSSPQSSYYTSQNAAAALSPHNTATLPPQTTGTTVSSISPHSTGASPVSPGLPPLPGVETYMMTPQPPQHYPPPPMSPPPAFSANDYNRPPVPPEPIHTPSYNPSDASTSTPTPKTPVYTPGAAAGPNGGIHAPGQIGHPNQQHGTSQYHHGLCDCFSDFPTCCLGYWCPCILYSRTYHRLKTVPNSNLNEFSSCNGHCGMFCLLAPVSFIFTTLQRSRIRENYRLEGSVANDCAKAYCCVMCTLVQDDREVNHREDERRRFAGPGSGVVGDSGYRRQPTMTYP